ncbi:MAG: tRNA dihydrouridine synthase DusB, partial [Clostridia bacterium]
LTNLTTCGRRQKNLKIANINLPSNAVLAPIAGFSDVGFRKICADLGASLTYTEMVSAKGLCYNGEKTLELLNTTASEKIVAVQIFGNDPDFMQRAAEHPALAKFDIIDINMGCPVPKIVKNGEGSALLNNIPLAQKVVEATCRAGKPVTVKTRIGFEQNSFVGVDFAKAMQDSGASAITIHGRTRAQMYSGKADWSAIAKIVQSVSIPVFANGDVFCKQDYIDIVEATGAAGVMIARGAIGNPFIFADISEKKTSATLQSVMLEHISTMRQFHPQQYVLNNFKKHLAAYAKGTPTAKEAKLKGFACESVDELLEVIKQYF